MGPGVSQVVETLNSRVIVIRLASELLPVMSSTWDAFSRLLAVFVDSLSFGDSFGIFSLVNFEVISAVLLQSL